MLNQVYTDLYRPLQKLFPIDCTIWYYQVSLATTWNLQPESDFPFPKIHSSVEIPAIPESYFYLESPGNKYYDLLPYIHCHSVSNPDKPSVLFSSG